MEFQKRKRKKIFKTQVKSKGTLKKEKTMKNVNEKEKKAKGKSNFHLFY